MGKSILQIFYRVFFFICAVIPPTVQNIDFDIFTTNTLHHWMRAKKFINIVVRFIPFSAPQMKRPNVAN